MQLTLPPDLQALVQRRLATGAFTSTEDVVRRALEAQEEDETWTSQEKDELNSKIDRALDQASSGQTFSPGEAREKLTSLRRQHLSSKG